MSSALPKLDALDLETLRQRKSEKWGTYPRSILPAWVAEMDYPLAASIDRVLRDAVERGDVGYPIAPNDTGLREVFAARMEDRFGWAPDPRDVEILSDVVQGMTLAVERFSDPGDGVVVQTPIYPPFLGAVRETRRRLDENVLVDGPNGYEIDFDALAAGTDERTRILLFCNPHNPTGRVFTRAELERLAELALERDWVVVTDEIHGDLVYPGGEHIPFATLAPEVAKRTVTLTSATKAFNIPGLRCACAHFGSSELRRRFNAPPKHVRGGLGYLGLYATAAAWSEGQPWLDHVLAYLEGNRDFLAGFVAERFPGAVHTPPQSTYLAWVDFRPLALPESPFRFFYDRAQVAISDGRAFGASGEGYGRINFATSRPLLTRILEAMARALEER
ncbi:MAG: PatB family C-S lyase [Proteobacteria bacterium]|nr:PatB family C-S lyase [Pseudomonadota bacterium]